MRLFGAKYDSLPSLLEKTFDDASRDPVVRYVTFLCAQQLTDWVEDQFPEFCSELGDKRARLDKFLGKLAEVRASLPMSEMEQVDEYLEWYELAFLGRPRDMEAPA